VSARVAAVVFDLYGTLLSIESMRAYAAQAGIADEAAFVADWRHKQLEYAFLTSLANGYRDFDELTALALDHTCAQRGAALDSAARSALARAWRVMPAFGDVVPALRALHERGIPLAVLTNGTPDSANAALEHAGVRELLTDILSVESARAYKPDPRVYALATARFACEPGDIVFVSSNGWDAWGAARFGFRVAWCNRARNAAETLGPPPETTLAGLHELAAWIASACRGYDPVSGYRHEVQRRMDDRTNSGEAGTAEEPGLTQKNSATVKGEETLADAGTEQVETSSRPRDGAIPSSYGSHGGVAPQADESSGANGSEE
jgi:2-haloacid dehalogenase